MAIPGMVFAGNDTKRGQAGATELTINPWAKSSGWAGAYTAGYKGIEAMNHNIAGLAYLKSFEFGVSNVQYMMGTGISLNTAAMGVRVAEGGVMGASVTSMSLGDFIETTYFQPDGTGARFSPAYTNFSVSYAQTFSEKITGGLLVRMINHAVPNANANGVAVDAGVMYHGGSRGQFKLGVALRNLGPKMEFTGDGLNLAGRIDNQTSPPSPYLLAVTGRSNAYDMPALLNVGVGYDWLLAENHTLTTAYNFCSNSFTADQHLIGLQYSFFEVFQLRSGYNLSQNLLSNLERTDVHADWSFGAGWAPSLDFITGKRTVDALDAADGETIGKKVAKSRLSLDYSYRVTTVFGGTHSLGLAVHF